MFKKLFGKMNESQYKRYREVASFLPKDTQLATWAWVEVEQGKSERKHLGMLYCTATTIGFIKDKDSPIFLFNLQGLSYKFTNDLEFRDEKNTYEIEMLIPIQAAYTSIGQEPPKFAATIDKSDMKGFGSFVRAIQAGGAQSV